MYVPEGSKYIFRKKRRHSNPYRVFVILTVLIMALFVLRGYASGEVKSPFSPTPTPTRVVNSYILEADTRFAAGDIDGAIAAYQQSLSQDPNNAVLLADLARVQTYSSTLKTTDDDILAIRQEALKNVNKAAELDPENSTVHAIRAFVLDWNASANLVSAEDKQRYMSDAEEAALQAIDLEPNNPLALAYSAEVLADQQRVLDAEARVNLALEKGGNLMDVHRVAAYVQESMAQYDQAIAEYQKALEITPNLTFLYMNIGYNYRTLGYGWELKNTIFPPPPNPFYEKALNSFAKVADINKQLGIKDPVPYVAISKTYAQMGEFFAASFNIQQALEYNPDKADLYGEAGQIFKRARNYESSEIALRCAVQGCDPDTSCEVRQCNTESDPPITITGIPLSEGSKWYYLDYGSVLAALHRPTDPKCPDAMEVFKELRQAMSSDTLAMSIVEQGEAICQSYGY